MHIKSDSAVFFDFDGVLIASLKIKTDAYKQIFKSCNPDIISEIVAYHQRHAGISRVDKIDYAHKHLLNRPYSRQAVSEHVSEYSRLVFEKVVAASWIPGAFKFVESNYQKTPLFVVSGTPEDELKEIIRRRNIQHYFQETLGSPIRKPEHIRTLLKRHNLRVKDCFFIGDALTDYYAAKETGMPFIGIQGETTFPEGTTTLPDCTKLLQAMGRPGC